LYTGQVARSRYLHIIVANRVNYANSESARSLAAVGKSADIERIVLRSKRSTRVYYLKSSTLVVFIIFIFGSSEPMKIEKMNTELFCLL